MVYSRAECVVILESYFASKSFAAIREAFSNAYPDKEVPNKSTIHWLVTKFRNTGSVCYKKHDRRPTVLTGEALRFNVMGRRPTLQKQQMLFCKSSWRVHFWVWFWPPRSPDFTPPVIFLWGFLKGRVHSNNTRSLEEQHNIEQTVDNTDPETLCKVARNTLETVYSLSSRKWWTLSASAVKLFCKFFLTNGN
jgi:hypothetical protein